MPIEFRCTSCAKMLRTPDESAGKKAKCPQCGTIVDVPEATEWAAKQDEVPGGEVPRDPFARPAGLGLEQQQDAINPYSAPTTIAQPEKPLYSTAELQHTQIGFDETLRQSFELTKSQLGPVALCGLVFIGINIGISIVSAILGGSLGAVGAALDMPALNIAGQVVQQVIGFLINIFFELAMINVGLRLARTGTVEISDLFKVHQYYGRGLLIGLLRALLIFGVILVFVGPALLTILTEEEAIFIPAIIIAAIPALVLAIYIFYRLYLCMCFLVDRDLGVMDSLRASDQFMVSNKLTTFLVLLVVNILGGLAVIFTCCVGVVVVSPYTMGIVAATIYLLATGQRVYDPLSAGKLEAPKV